MNTYRAYLAVVLIEALRIGNGVGVFPPEVVGQVKEFAGVAQGIPGQRVFPNVLVEYRCGSQCGSCLPGKLRPRGTGVDEPCRPVHCHVLGAPPVTVVRLSLTNLAVKLVLCSVSCDEVVCRPLEALLYVFHLVRRFVPHLKTYCSPGELGRHGRHGKAKLDIVAG